MAFRCASGDRCSQSWLLFVILLITVVVTCALPSDSASLQVLDDHLTKYYRRKTCLKAGRICGFRRRKFRCCRRNRCMKILRKGKKIKKIFRCLRPTQSPSPSPSSSPCPEPDACVSFWNGGTTVTSLGELAMSTAQCNPPARFLFNRVEVGAPLCTVTCPGEERCPRTITAQLSLQSNNFRIADCLAHVIQLGFAEGITIGPCGDLDVTGDFLQPTITQSMRDAALACEVRVLDFFFYDFRRQDIQSDIANACN